MVDQVDKYKIMQGNLQSWQIIIMWEELL